MASVNRVFLLGNLVRDPETRHSADGMAVTNVTIATNRRWKDKATGEAMAAPDFHNLVFFGRLAEIAGEHLKKGRPAHVEGSLRTRKWQDKEGTDRYTTEIVVDDLQLLGTPPKSGTRETQPVSTESFEDDVAF